MNQSYESEIMEKDRACYLPVFTRYPLVLDHGAGAYVYDVNGRRYLDALGGIAVNVLGHGYPALVDAVAAQAGRRPHLVHSRRRRIDVPSSAVRESTTREPSCRQKGQCTPRSSM